jgi:MFS family permease
MNQPLSPPSAQTPTRVRYGVLAFACVLSMITYLDRVCFGTVAPFIQKDFGLTDDQLGMIFSAFALAYAVFEVPSGWLGDVYGPRRTLIRIVIWWSAFTVLTGLIWPTTSPGWAWYPFLSMLTVRFLFGMGEAGAYPNISRAFYNWIPFRERGTAQGAVWMAGRFAGGMTGFLVTALLITVVLPDGTKEVLWRHTFWIFGALGVVWCALFWWWFRDRPAEHPKANAAEVELITRDMPAEASHSGVPWLKMMTSLNLWVICLMYFCASYGWYFNITWLPKFLKQHNIVPGDALSPEFWRFGLLAGAPLLLGSLACLFGGLLTDMFIRRTGNRKWGRRLFGVLGHGLCALCYFFAIFVTHDPWLLVLAVASAAFWNDITMGSAWASCQDIGRKYAGIVSGCMNTIGNLGGAVAGYATGLVLRAHTAAVPEDAPKEVLDAATQQGWTVNFIIFASVYVAAAVLWLFFDATKPVVPDEH